MIPQKEFKDQSELQFFDCSPISTGMMNGVCDDLMEEHGELDSSANLSQFIIVRHGFDC